MQQNAGTWAWVAVSLIAALAQTGRNAAQAGLTRQIGTMGATGVRFLFGLPFAAAFLALLVLGGAQVPLPGAPSLGFAAMGAVAQIAATALMLVAMQQRGFALATALTKTEPVFLALMGVAILGDRLGPLQMAAIGLATAGVLVTSGGWQRSAPAAAAVAMLAGALFGLSAVGFRGAITALGAGSDLIRASTVLVVTLAMQVAMVGAWLALRQPATLRAIARRWRGSLTAGLLGALASQFWFLGFALTSAANVRTLALIEVVFAAMVSRRRNEAISGRELAGMALILAGVGWLLLQQRG